MAPPHTPDPADDRRLAPLSDDEFALLADFRYVLRRFLSYSEEAARGAGITPQHYLALLAVRGFRGGADPTIGQLAEQLQIRHHSVVGLVDRLVSQELMVRRPGTDDKRQVYLALTERGKEFLDRLAAGHLAQLRNVGGGMERLLRRLLVPGRAEEDERP
jgi:DNA-binding MarR family transcriptional regulator